MGIQFRRTVRSHSLFGPPSLPYRTSSTSLSPSPSFPSQPMSFITQRLTSPIARSPSAWSLGSVVMDFQHRGVSVWSAPPSLLYGFCKPLTCFVHAQNEKKGAVSSDKFSWYPTRFLTSRIVNHQPNHLHACIQDVRPRLRKARSRSNTAVTIWCTSVPSASTKMGNIRKKRLE